MSQKSDNDGYTDDVDDDNMDFNQVDIEYTDPLTQINTTTKHLLNQN